MLIYPILELNWLLAEYIDFFFKNTFFFLLNTLLFVNIPFKKYDILKINYKGIFS